MRKPSETQNATPKRIERAGVSYDRYATEQWAILISFFRWYPDILEDICAGANCEYENSLMGRVTKRYLARYQTTFTYATRGYGKTTDIVSDKCNKGILFPGEVTGYYAPVEKQAAPLASKAFAGYERNYPILAHHWKVNSDSKEYFKISTPNGSKFIMDIDRGMDTSGVVAEECGQEDKNPFNWDEFNQIVLGTNRKQYYVNGKPDKTHIDFQEHYITSASRKENEAFQVCMKARKEMQDGESAFATFIPWQVPVLCRMKPYGYYKNLKRRLTAEQFMRECESKCTGSSQNPIIRDNVLQAAKRIMVMEDKHCGDPDCNYVIGYDVSSRDIAGNALSAMSVIKYQRQGRDVDHYMKSLVYVMDSPPPSSAKEHAYRIKSRWRDYIKDGKFPYIVIDARQYGQSVVERLHEDMGDGLPPLCTIYHEDPYRALEQPGAIPCIYPLQATGASGRDPNTAMLDYIEREFENGNFLLLTANLVDGMKAYKLKHNITDDNDDVKIQLPYIKTKELGQQISNLQKKYSAGGWTEVEISKSIVKDMWSATLYASRMVQRIEHDELYYLNRNHNAWEEEAESGGLNTLSSNYVVKTRFPKRLGRGAFKR